MSSKDYKEPEDGGMYGARPVKADQKDDIHIQIDDDDDDDDDVFGRYSD